MSAERREGLAVIARRFDARERLAALAALGIVVAMLLPWYGVSLEGRALSLGRTLGGTKSAFEAFSFVEAALLVLALAVLTLLVECRRNRALPLPWHEGTLLAAAGVWSAFLVGFRLFDRPALEIGGIETSYDLRFGALVALACAIALAVAGLRHRRAEGH